MIIHIMGNSGAGKTTLGNRLRKLKNVVVLDTDDIDDPNTLKIIGKYTTLLGKDYSRFEKELSELNTRDLKAFLDRNSRKHIVIVGFLHLGMQFASELVDKKFAIKVDFELLWRRYNLRTLEAFEKHGPEIRKLLSNTEYGWVKIRHIMSKKYGIRNGADCLSPHDLEKFYKDGDREFNRKNKIAYKPADEIYADIVSALQVN